MKNERKRHHIIPQFYLKKWTDLNQPDRTLVWILDKNSLQGICTSPKNAFVEKHYFTEQELDGTRNDPVETCLSELVETEMGMLLPAIEAGQPLTTVNQRTLWTFVLTMFMRVDWWRQPLKSLIDPALTKARRKVVDKIIEENSKNRNTRLLRRQAKSKAYRREISAEVEQKSSSYLETLATSLATKIHPMLVMASLTLEELQKELQTYPFKIVRIDGLPLLSSDTPCVVEEDPSILEFEGENVPKVAFICPLTPKLAFVGGLGLSTGYTTTDSEWVRRFNARIRANAQKDLIANTNTVDDSWFLTDTNSPLTMREIILQSQNDSPVIKTQSKGFGSKI
ncbi:DUF4238 domain-containing protein [Coleofasciculus sp. G2-EDA-02]|uniref:DUF4238 domain-containing protein n=1 Tax=Coleofasciculus sp. G2-EDA-02 TaxID=3069529 RepID=UPI0032F0BA6F